MNPHDHHECTDKCKEMNPQEQWSVIMTLAVMIKNSSDELNRLLREMENPIK